MTLSLPPSGSPSPIHQPIQDLLHEEMRIVAVPLSILAHIPEATSYLAHPIIVRPIGGAAYVVAGITNALFWSSRQLFEKMHEAKIIETAKQSVQGVLDVRYTQVDQAREAKGEAIQTGLQASEWTMRAVSAIPVVGTAASIASGLAAGAQIVERTERSIEQSNLYFAKLRSMGGIKVMEVVANTLLQAGWGASRLGERGTEWMKTLSWSLWENPSALQDPLAKLSDRMKAVAFLYAHSAEPHEEAHFTSQESQLTDFRALRISMSHSITPADIQAYEQKPARYKQDILTLITHYQNQLELTKEETTRLSLAEIVALEKILKAGLPSLFFPQERITLPINAQNQAQTVQDEEIADFQALATTTQNALIRATGHNERTDLKEIVGLIKTLKATEKLPHLPLLQLQHTISPQQASLLVSDTELEQVIDFDSILFLVANSTFLQQTPEHMQRYSRAAEQRAHIAESVEVKQALKELLGLYKLLPANEKQKLTPKQFHVLDPSKKSALFHLVRDYTPKLSTEDRALLTDRSIRQMSVEELDPSFEAFLVKKFNSLSPEIKKRLSGLSYEEFVELPEKTKIAFVQALAEKIPEVTEITSKDMYERAMDLFFTLPNEQQIEIYNKIDGASVVFTTNTTEIEHLIVSCKERLEQIDSHSDEAMHLSRLKSWLEQQTHISAIDMSAILEKVGPHVLTASQAFLPKRLGEFAYVLTTIPETPTFSVCKLLEVASSPFLTRPILAIAAFFLRYGLILPQAQEALMEHLPGALPLERLLQSVPQTVLTLTGEIESFIVARISDSLNGLQKATSELLDLRRLLDAQRQFGPVLLEQRVELAKQDLAISYNFLTNSVKSLCSGKDAVGKFLCDPDIRSYLTGDPAKLQELAAKYNLTPEDSGFLTLLENMIKTGKPISITDVLLEKAQDTETAEKAGQIVNNVLEIRANTHTLIESLWQTAVGRAATEVGKAVSESSLGTYTASFASAVSAPVTKALDATNTLFRQLRGVEQAIPEELKQDLTLIQIYQENLSQAKADEELYTTAIARLYAIQQSSWQKYLLLPIAEQKVYSDAMKASLSVLQKAVDMLKPCLHVAKANTLLASAQLAPEPVAEHYLSAPATTSLQSTMALGALKSVVSLASDPGKIKQVQAVTGLIMNGTVNAAQLSALCGGTLSILPNFIRHFIPPLLDTYGPALAENTHSFFHNLATGSLTLFDAPGRWAQASAEAAGTWALHYAMHTLGFVSQARIDNFMKLTDQEKLHLIDLAKAATQDPKALKKLQGTAQEQAECALSILDSLSTEDQLRISPTSFLSLSPEKQEKIMQIVHRYGGLKKSEQNNPVVIVKKFNELDPWIRQQVDMMSIQDFVRMSSDRQEDFRFYLVQSGSYEGATIEEKRKFFLKIKNMTNRELEALIPDMAALTAKDKAHLTPASLRKMHPAEIHQVLEIVQRYHPELLHKRLDVKRLEKYLQKPPIDYVEDKIRDDLPFITTQPLSEDTFDQLLPAQKNQIVTFLHTFSKFADLEFESGDEFDVDLITGAFNSLLEPELPIQQKERETLLETLAFVFHELPISEKKELLSLTQPVWNSYKKSEQIRLIQFLCSQPGFETRFSRLNQQILNLESGNAVDIDFVLTCFNSLQPFAQSNFKKTHQDSLEIPETLKANVQREVLHIRAKLKVIEEKLIKLRKYEYPTYQQRLHQALTNNDQDKTVQAKKGLENTIKKAQALEHERDKLSKELKTLQKLCDTGFRFNEEIERAFFEDESITALEAEQARLAKALKKFAAHVFEAKAAILLQKTDLGEFKTTLRSYQQECTEIENSLYRTCREYEDLALSLSQTIAERTAQGRHLTELLQAIDQHIQASRSLTHTALIWKDTRAEEAAKRALIHRAKTACQESITGLDQEHMRLQRLQSDKSAEQQKEDALAKTETNPTIKTAHEERSKALKTEIAYIDQQRSEIKARYEKLKAVYENASISLKQLHQVLEEEMLLIEQEKIDKQMQRTVLQIVHIPANAEMQTAFDEARKKFNKQVEEIRARLADQ